MKNNTLAIVAIAATVAVLLIATTPTLLLTNDASAKKSFHETAAQSCVNQNARCQDLLSQIQGHNNAANVIGNQPTAAAAPVPEPATLIVTKVVVCPVGDFACPSPSDFEMNVNFKTSFPGSSSGTTVTLSAGPYSVREVPPIGVAYVPTFSADCSGEIHAGEVKHCLVTNTIHTGG